MQRLSLISHRNKSILAEKLRNAVSGGSLNDSKQATGSITVKDENGEDFRELFVMPKRKLRGQMQLEQATGRAEVRQRSRIDINDRLALRTPRSQEMDPEQDWTNVWPAAKTFSSSVVPLPVRMGSRPNVEKRAPFKKEGNLELVKIPNFLHLTPAAIEKHCKAIKKFCTPFPKELMNNQSFLKDNFPIEVSYNTYIHQGTNIRDIRGRVVTMTVNVNKLNLNQTAKDKLKRLSGDRYDPETETISILTDRCYTRKQNLDYAYYLLTVLYHEANKVESWEELQSRADHLRVEFKGSETQNKLISLIEKAKNSKKLKCDANESDIEKFGKVWTNYRNQEETPESTREYGRQIKKLLGFEKVSSTTSQPHT